MVTFEQLSLLVLVAEKLECDSRHALLSLLTIELHKHIEASKTHIRRGYEYRHYAQTFKQALYVMRKRVTLLRNYETMLKRVHQLAV